MASLIETAVNAVTAAVQATPTVSPTVGGSAVSSSNPLPTTPGVIAQSVSKGGMAAAPTAGSAIVSLPANQPAGTYKVRLTYSISGAIEAAGLNVRLSDASGGFTSVDFPSNNGSVGGQSWFFTIDALTLASSTNTIKITAVANATASTVYSATLSIYRIA